MHSAPLWERKARLPAAGILRPKVAFMRTSGCGIDHAQAVGADQRNAGRPDLVANLVLQRRPFGADFLEAGRDHHQAVDLLGHRLVDHAQRRRGGNDQHGQVDRPGDGAERG